MFYVYALQSQKDKNLYIGISKDPEDRVIQHNKGMTKSTKHRRPLKLIYKKSCENRTQARRLEKKLKSGSGREFLKSLL